MLDFGIIVFIVMLIIVACFMHPILMEEIPCFYFALLSVSVVSMILNIFNIVALTLMIKCVIWCVFIGVVIYFIYIFIVNCFY